ncbi:hypothetical protein PVAP13_5KG062687, partial [Panicum virgatum]
AARGYAELHDKVIGDFLGPILWLKIWHPADEFGYDVADHHGYISIQELPLHLWKKDAEEQILHPYCAVNEAVDHTKTRSDLSTYACFGWSLQRVAIPKIISLKVVKKTAVVPQGFVSFLNTAISKQQAAGFLGDQTTYCFCNLNNVNTRYETL